MSIAIDYSRAEGGADDQALKAQYLASVRMIERVHRLLLDVIKDEFERIGRSDVNSVQALLLFHIGDAELTAGELRTRGYYLGSNVSYNLKKLVHSGYIHHKKSPTDRRSVRVNLTPKGKEVSQLVNKLFERQLTMIEKVGGVSAADFRLFNQIVQRLERFWSDQIRYRL
jgi:DNA-binding MarR family transcriptional regulator